MGLKVREHVRNALYAGRFFLLPFLPFMPIESKSRMVSFRLTAEEYDRFRFLCLTRGHGSVSAMLRDAVNALVGESPAAPAESVELHARFASLESRLHDLATVVTQIQLRLDQSHHSQVGQDHTHFQSHTAIR